MGPRSFNLLAAVLVPVTSFVHFVHSQGYPLLAPEILIPLLGVAVAGMLAGLIINLRPRALGPIVIAALITWFIDVNVLVNARPWFPLVAFTFMAVVGTLAVFGLGLHLSRLASVIFGTVLLSTLALPGGTSTTPTPGSSAAPDRPDLPVVVHLILDEHVGFAGIPDDAEDGQGLRNRLEAFYGRHNFYTFRRAFSQYFETRYAVSHALNFAETFDATLIRKGSDGFLWRLSRNAYVEYMRQRGYRLQVYQPEFMSLCPEIPAAGERCYTYTALSLKVLERTALPTPAKLRITVSAYLFSSTLYKKSRAHYQAFRGGRFGRYLALPEWNWERSRAYTIAALSAFDRIREDLSQARPGDLFLAHLLIPHAPYVYNASCALQMDPGEWLDRGLPEGAAEAHNSAQSRAVRYGLYVKQVECVTRKVDEILTALRERGVLDRAIVLVHGDHGSRITRAEPFVSNRDKMTAADFTDSFSTLFAVRAPGVKAGLDDHPWSLVELMRHFVTEDFRGTPVRRPGQPMADVYMWKDGTDSYQPMQPQMVWWSGRGDVSQR